MLNLSPFSPGIYTSSSLISDIEKACDRSLVLDFELLANICLKYLFVFLDKATPTDAIDGIDALRKYVEILGALCQVYKNNTYTLVTPTGVDHPKELIEHVAYQVAMLIDIPATVAIMQDIIQRVELLGREQFIGWDLGTGSGILGVGQYIGSHRSATRKVKVIGFEIGEVAQIRANKIWDILGVGTVTHSDTTKPETYQEREAPHFITNENLPSTGIPFEYLDRKQNRNIIEPFLRNMEALQEHFGTQKLSEIAQFPRGLEWGNLAESPPVFKKDLSENLYGLNTMNMVAMIGRRGRDGIIFPHAISLGGKWERLDSIGEEYRSKMMHPSLSQTRWRKTDPKNTFSSFLAPDMR